MDTSGRREPERRPPGWSAGDTLPAPVIKGKGRTAVRLELVAQGRDLVLLIAGGEAHVGAAAIGPAPGEGPTRTPAVAVLPPHKEGPLAEECAATVAAAAGCTVCAVAGIHLEGITQEEIAAVVDNARRGAAALARALLGGC